MPHLISKLALAALTLTLASGGGAQVAPRVPITQIPIQAPGVQLGSTAAPASPLRRRLPVPAVPRVALPSQGKAPGVTVVSPLLGRTLDTTVAKALPTVPLPYVSLGVEALPSVSLRVEALPSVSPSADALPLLGAVTTDPAIASRTGAVAAPAPSPLLVRGVQPIRMPTVLLERRRSRIEELLRQHPHEIELDEQDRPIRRGIIIAVDADPAQLRQAAKVGFQLLAEERHLGLGLRVAKMAVPRGMSAPRAMKRLRRAVPLIDADYDHLFEPTGGALAPVAGTLAAGRLNGGPRIGMIDGGVGSHPSLAKSAIAQRGFAGNAQPTGHGTAVASLMVGREGRFRGAARGASLLVGDVYSGNRAAGSASVIVRALGWLVSHRPSVINISLVGPSNKALARAVQAVRARGIHIVAAVGNDGPAAPPPYPASYPGVIAVTGVDSQGRALVEAGSVDQLDFAAPGADMAAARPGRGYARVRGTSFASPLAAARLAAVGSPARLASEARPGKGRVGRGIVCADCRNDPGLVGAK